MVLSGGTFRTAFPVALVVGTLLCAVNQGALLLAGAVDTSMVLRMVSNYAVPYLVASVGLLSASRTRERALSARVPISRASGTARSSSSVRTRIPLV